MLHFPFSTRICGASFAGEDVLTAFGHNLCRVLSGLKALLCLILLSLFRAFVFSDPYSQPSQRPTLLVTEKRTAAAAIAANTAETVDTPTIQYMPAHSIAISSAQISARRSSGTIIGRLAGMK